jgi:LuxR family transcriptional regulator, maltose regulon positive regulatory protein
MTGTSFPLRQTKLQRPRVLRSVVGRPRLWTMLDESLEKPLTLVCAGPGFGKTTLVSSWLDEMTAYSELDAAPSVAWLSLDEHDGDLIVFLHYVIAALRTVVPDACAETLRLLQALQPHQIDLLETTLINDLVKLPSRIILVLDDYSAVRSDAVDSILIDLARNWPQPLHLVLITRRNPPLPLPSLRAKDALTEIRSHDLRFSHQEIIAFLANVLPEPIDEAAVAQLEQQTEGWIAGLKLTTHSLRNAVHSGTTPAALAVNAANINEYLVADVFANQPVGLQRFLLETSIVDHFCPALCSAILSQVDPEWDPERCISWLVRTDMFIVLLNNQTEWYRYHHLFAEMLRQKLNAEQGADAVAALHRRAAVWLAQQGYIDDALHHAISADDFGFAAQLVAQALPEALNREDRPMLERWLSFFPEAIILQRPELLLLKAWALQFSWRLQVQVHVIRQVESLLYQKEHDHVDGAYLRALRAQIALLRGQELFHSNRPASAVALLSGALQDLPAAWTYLRGGTVLYLGVSLQAVGHLAAAERLLLERFEPQRDKADGFALRHYLSLCFVYSAEGKLEKVRQVAVDMLRLVEGTNLVTMQSWAHYFLGLVHYQWNELEVAENHFAAVLEWRHTAISVVVRESLVYLAIVRHLLGRYGEAESIADALGQLDLNQQGREDDTTHALRASLLLQQGNLVQAARWADAYTVSVPDRPLIWFSGPHMTVVRILLARGDEADLLRVSDILDALSAIAERTYNARAGLDLLAMRSVALYLQGRVNESDAILGIVVARAKPDGFVRIFADLGDPMLAMLQRLARQNVDIRRLLASLAEDIAGDGAPTLSDSSAHRPQVHSPPLNAGIQSPTDIPEPLTTREREVLALLGEPLSNKDIARRLHISYATVKRHTVTIYGKLGVNSRWEAVSKVQSTDNGKPQ